MKIVLMTSNIAGGIIQFTIQLYHTLLSLGHLVKICIPETAINNNTNEVPNEEKIIYKKTKKIINKSAYKNLAKSIENEEPDCIWYCDPSVVCIEVGLRINNKNIKQVLTIHDAGGYHPTNHLNPKVILQRLYENMLLKKMYAYASKILLLSPQSIKKFCETENKFKHKAVQINLGAHIPVEKPTMPIEIKKSQRKEFLLFFGRIDKYKGLLNLFKAYKEVDGSALPLVVAGNGRLSEEENILIKEIENVILINRFISDGEMKWLFENSKAVLLPYIEATQSGVIPIAYSYNKPVIVSNIDGLTQFVVDGDTGCVCKNQKDWISAMKGITNDTLSFNNILEYFNENMNWENNVRRLIKKI